MDLQKELQRCAEASAWMQAGEETFAFLSKYGVLSPVLYGVDAAYSYVREVYAYGRMGAKHRKERVNMAVRFQHKSGADPLTNRKGYSVCNDGAFFIVGHTKGSTRVTTIGRS